MAILAGCDHMVMTVGSFGFWAAYLGADAKGGEVVYYDSEFKMEHPTNKGNVVLEDYYPEGWVAMGGAPTSVSESKWASALNTIVTAYFEIPSKHSSKEYDAWMANMLSLQDPMVIYTTADLVPTIERLRANAMDRTRIVPMALEDTRVAKRYDAAFWKAQHQMDPERGIHKDVRLYWVWNSKAEFLKRTVDSNPFQSTYFAWVDIGYFRSDKYNSRTMLQHHLDPLKITLLEIPKGNVGGGFIGGGAEAIERWSTLFYAMLDRHKDKFIGKDQPYMRRTCDENPGLCKLVEPDQEHEDPWFYMAPYMMGETIHVNDPPICSP
jgi:hypothetical protein